MSEIITMSEHDWVQEHIASFHAGGLESDERDRLEKHVASCAECRAGLDELRSLDHKIGSLFATVRPNAAIEDRMIQSLRAQPQRQWRPHWIIAAAAAIILLGCVGVLAENIIRLGFPTGPFLTKALFRFEGDPRVYRESFTVDDSSSNDSKKLAGGEGRERLKDVDQLAREWGEKNQVEVLSLSGQEVVKDSSRIRAQRSLLDFDGSISADLNGTVANSPSSPPKEFFSQTRLGREDSKPAFEPRKGPPRVTAAYDIGDLSGARSLAESKGKDAPVPNSFNALSLEAAKAKESKDLLAEMNKTQTGSLLSDVGKSSDKGGEAKQSQKRDQAADVTRAQGELMSNQQQASLTKEQARSAQQEQAPTKSPDATASKGESQAKGPSDPLVVLKQRKPSEFVTGLTPAGTSTPPIQAPPASRKVIRSGDMEFEIQSFDSAVAAITRLINDIKGGFVATINSDKLPNGKVRGAVVVRVPPDTLDTLLLDLRKDLGKFGELKGMKVGSQDITKQYTDLESHLRAALAMQERLLQMIKEGKGAIKDLLQAEKELGVWRTKIEELEGEIRYYNNLVALSTLTINLYEKEIRAPFGVIETERVLMGLEVEDVEKAHKQVLAAVAEAKGRISKSELKQHTPDQLSAIVNFEVAPESAGPLRDRLRQLGNVARLEADRLQQTEGGTGRPQDGKKKQNDTQFFVSLFNLATFTPRETITIQLAVKDVAAAYRALQDTVSRVKGKLVNFDFDERDKQNITAQLDFDIRRTDEPTINPELAKIGDVFSRKVVRTPDKDDVLDSKVRLLVSLVSQSRIPPRETVILGIEVPNVDKTAERLAAFVSESSGRIAESNIAHERNGRVTAKLVYDVPLSSATGLVQKFGAEGVVRVQKSSRNEQVPDSTLSIARIDVTLSNTDLIVPSDEGLWPQVRRGLSTSVTALSWSLTVVIIGVCFVLPWVIVIYTAYRIVLRFRRGRATSPA